MKKIKIGSGSNLKSHRNMMLFAYEGVLIALINNFINNNNNLFATRLGATDFQLSLVASLPQFVGMLVLIPGGIFTDRMKNKRQMVILSLTALAVLYGTIVFVPMLGKYSLIAFILLISLSIGPMTLYNTSWQAYFSDIVPIGERNKVFTLRTKWTFVINVAASLLTGTLLASVPFNSQKIRFHQAFLVASCIFILLQILTLKKISGGSSKAVSSISFRDLKDVAVELSHNRRFLGFMGVALFFYMGWQSDWALFYIGQVNYLKLNEAWLSYVGVGGAAVQFLTIGFWSRVNERKGVRFSLIPGALGLSLFPLVMIICTKLPSNIAPIVFVILCTLSNFAFATLSLNILQCLLQVIPEKNKTLSISVYTLLISLSNALMPMAGVKLYTMLGANLKALQITFFVIFAMRITAAGLWALRWWMLRGEPK
jgi:MFS family permease